MRWCVCGGVCGGVCAVCCVIDDNYHMTGKNCNSFSDALCVALLDKYPAQPNHTFRR